MLMLTVNESMPGDEVQVGKNARVRVRAQAWAPEVIGSPKLLEIVSHGRVIRSALSSDPTQERLGVEFELPAGESQWIAARTFSFNGAHAHTSPVYLIVDGASFADRSQVQQLVAERLKVLEFIENQMSDTSHPKWVWPSELPLFRQSIQDAREKYQTVENMN